MTRASIKSRSVIFAGATAALAFTALGFAGTALARDNFSLSVGIGIPAGPVGVVNAYPVYSQPLYQQQPVFVQQQPVYVQPAPVYLPRPVYYGGPVYIEQQPAYYGYPGRWHGNKHRGGYYVQGPQGYGYAPIYYRGRKGEGRHRDRDDD